MQNSFMYRLPPGCVAVREIDYGQYQALVCLDPKTLSYEGQVAVVGGIFASADEACEAGFSVLAGGAKRAAEPTEVAKTIESFEEQAGFPFENPDGH